MEYVYRCRKFLRMAGDSDDSEITANESKDTSCTFVREKVVRVTFDEDNNAVGSWEIIEATDDPVYPTFLSPANGRHSQRLGEDEDGCGSETLMGLEVSPSRVYIACSEDDDYLSEISSVVGENYHFGRFLRHRIRESSSTRGRILAMFRRRRRLRKATI